jgi:hypothetical protein
VHPARSALTLIAATSCLLGPACASPSTGLDARAADGAAPVDGGVGLDRAVAVDTGAPLDGGAAGDASAPLDVGPDAALADAGAPTTGCFAGDLTLATVTAEGGARAHITPLHLIARPGGWVVYYERNDRPGGWQYAMFLGAEGQLLREEPTNVERASRAYVQGDAVVFFGDVGVDRVDLGIDRTARDYLGVSFPSVATTVGSHLGGWRRLATYYVNGNQPRYTLSDVELADDEPRGLRVHTAVLEGTESLGSLSGYYPEILGHRLQLLGTGGRASGEWRVVLVDLGAASAARAGVLDWSTRQDVAWGLAVPPRRITAQTVDGRWAVVERDALSTIEPLPLGGVLPPDAPSLALPSAPRQLFDEHGRVTLLYYDRLTTLDGASLAPLGELAIGAEARAAEAADRVAAVWVVRGEGDAQANLVLRCLAVPRAE